MLYRLRQLSFSKKTKRDTIVWNTKLHHPVVIDLKQLEAVK